MTAPSIHHMPGYNRLHAIITQVLTDGYEELLLAGQLCDPATHARFALLGRWRSILVPSLRNTLLAHPFRPLTRTDLATCIEQCFQSYQTRLPHLVSTSEAEHENFLDVPDAYLVELLIARITGDDTTPAAE